MQNYTEISLDDGLSDSLAMILDNDKTALSCSSGTAFPTVNVQIGQLCFRTDENRLYQTKDGTNWIEVADLSKSFTQHIETLNNAISTQAGVIATNKSSADSAIALRAPIASPTLTGVPKAPTAATGNNSTQIATTAFVSSALSAAISEIMGGAPSAALDTLYELGKALGDDANFAATMTQALATKVNLSGGTLTGSITAPSFIGALTGNAATATKLQTARTINGVAFDGSANITIADSTKLPLAGGTITGALTVNGLITAGSNGIKTAKIDSTSAVAFLNDNAAQNIHTGGVLVSNAYADSAKIPTNGIYSKGKIHTATSVEVGSSVDGVKDTDYVRATIHPPTHTGGDWEHTVRDDATYAYYKLKYGTSGHLQLRSDGALSASGGFDGNASTATKLQTARTIALSGAATGTATSFDGSTNISIAVTSLDATKLSGTASISTAGNAGTATKLATARAINGVSFDGSSNVTIGEPTFASPLMSYASGDANALNTGGFNVRYLNQSATNKPLGTDHAVMTLNYSAIWSGQQAFDWRTGDVFTRTQNNGTWLDWATQVDTRNYAKTIPTFSVNGVGLVPARVGSTTTKFLREDGTWVVPTDTTYEAMTAVEAAAGVATTARLIAPSELRNAIQTHAPTPTSVAGNAGTATKLATARTINGVAFDGTANITIEDSTKLPTTGGTITGALAVNGLLLANGGFKGHYVATDNRALVPSATPKGAIGAYFTSQGGLTGAANAVYGDLLALNSYNDTSGGLANALFFAKGGKSIFHYQAAQGATSWGAASQLAYVTDNVASATKLATARTINGTAFDGTASITTANWGTARTLTVGNTGKSVNGSANVSWTLAEIGAAAANHEHSYLPLSGGTVSGNVEITDYLTTSSIRCASDFGFYTPFSGAQRVLTGGLLVSNAYVDASKIPSDGIYSKGEIVTETGRISSPTSAYHYIDLGKDGADRQIFGSYGGVYYFRNTVGNVDVVTINNGSISANGAITGNQFRLTGIGDTNYITNGNGDAASYSSHNMIIRSWWGIGFRDNNDVCRTVLDTRTGNLSTLGTIAAASVVASGNVTAFSDKRIKENVTAIENALTKVEKLNGVTFKRKDTLDRQTGLLAQEVEAVLPEAVTRQKASEEIKAITGDEEVLAVNYGALTGLLVESIKELNGKLKAQQELIDKQAKLIENLLAKSKS